MLRDRDGEVVTVGVLRCCLSPHHLWQCTREVLLLERESGLASILLNLADLVNSVSVPLFQFLDYPIHLHTAARSLTKHATTSEHALRLRRVVYH